MNSHQLPFAALSCFFPHLAFSLHNFCEPLLSPPNSHLLPHLLSPDNQPHLLLHKENRNFLKKTILAFHQPIFTHPYLILSLFNILTFYSSYILCINFNLFRDCTKIVFILITEGLFFWCLPKFGALVECLIRLTVAPALLHPSLPPSLLHFLLTLTTYSEFCNPTSSGA